MPLHGDSGGFLLLVTESFAVRALLGSLAAATLAAVLVGAGVVRTRRARRLAILAPVLTAAAAGVASIGEVYLPLEAVGEHWGIVTERGIDALVLTYTLVVGVLVARRLAGVVAVRGTVRCGTEIRPEHVVSGEVTELARSFGIRSPRVVLIEDCPGGSFTTGSRRTVVALDPAILARLDSHERQGLLAHELAHIRRHDTSLALLVGLSRDLAFFLPPLHLAARWLRREQEEGADELASSQTGRPVALASSILKVWDCARDRRALAGVCAAVPGARLALPSGVLASGSSTGETLRTITARMERLIARLPAPSRLRQCAEGALACAVIVAGSTAALTVPSWIDDALGGETLSFAYLSAPPAMPVESPALATFRALTPTVEGAGAVGVTAGPAPAPAAEAPAAATAALSGCPCVESQSQLSRGEAAAGRMTPTRLAWGSADRPPWEVRTAYTDASIRSARPLVMLSDTGSQVGVFLVSRADR